jgi:hypothetical protein
MWEVLGIGATDDPAAIRRAYAVRLKALDPDRDPEGFRALRQAYESALARTRYARRPRVVPPAANKVEPEIETKPDLDADDDGDMAERGGERTHSGAVRTPSEPDTLFANAQAESAAALSKFRRSLADGDWTAAAAQLVSASARGLLPLADEEALAADVMTGAMADRDLAPSQLRSLAQQVRWDGPLPWNRGAHDKMREQVQERLEAEAWYASLFEQAAYPPPRGLSLHGRLWGDPKRIERSAAMMVLGRMPPTHARYLKKWLDPLLVQAQRHQASLGTRIDPGVIDQLKNKLNSAPKPVRKGRWLWFVIGIVALQVLLALVNGH